MENLAVKLEMIPIESIKLDHGNPRIAQILEIYGDSVPAEAISLALSGGSSDSGTTYDGLRESIKTNGGIVHPIIVDKTENGYTVIEGNTRVQIYSEFKKAGVTGNWSHIPAMVYENLPETQKHQIRLQSHLVGPRAWEPYAKAKYLADLSNKDKLPISEIISYSGGSKNEVASMIKAYEDMETYYRPNLPADDAFDQKKFSFFKELQTKRTTDALINNKFSKQDYAKWVINENIVHANIGPRQLGRILGNHKAREIFLNSDENEALKYLNAIEIGVPTDDTITGLANRLSDKIKGLPFQEIKKILDGDINIEGLVYLQADLEDLLNTLENMR